MVNALHLLHFHTPKPPPRKRKPVKVPTSVPTTDAMFVVLRRMRAPFIFVIVMFSIASAGMMIVPGKDDQGHTYHMTVFDAVYQMAITLTTVGFTEAPYSFTYPQRMWMSFSLFMLVLSWAYAIGVFFSVLQQPAFQTALANQRFRRGVHRLREPFVLIAGYGRTGRTVGFELDERRRRFVVVDNDDESIDAALTDPLVADVAAMQADCRNPAVLGAAGLGLPHCTGVLALTDDDEANLAVVMTVSLLRPDLPVYARCQDRKIQHRIEDFGPTAVINPDDRYGGYLALAMHRPVTYQLLTWLMDNDQTNLPAVRGGLTDGQWIVCGDGEFAHQVTSDLRESGMTVRLATKEARMDLTGAVGFVAGTDNDLTNIALAEHARIANPDIYVSIRQQNAMHRPLLTALDADSVYVPTELVAREALARIINPTFWSFIEGALVKDNEEWATATRDKMVKRVGRRTPERELITLSPIDAPAVTGWLASHELTLGDLFRHPADRDAMVSAIPMLLIRDDEVTITPDDDLPLRPGDQLLVAGKEEGLQDLSEALFSPSAVEYVATGHQVPSTWVWRALTHARRTA